MEALHIHYSVQETECCKVPRDLWVIAQQELTLDYGGSDCTFSFSVPQYPPPPRPSAQADRHHTEPKIVSQLCCGQTAGDGCTVWLQKEWRTVLGLSCVSAALDHGQPWLVKKGFFPLFTALLGLQWDLWGKQSEECGRRRGRLSDLQITHGKKQIGLIWGHAHTCARGKGYQDLHCCTLSQSIRIRQHQTEFQQCAWACFISSV